MTPCGKSRNHKGRIAQRLSVASKRDTTDPLNQRRLLSSASWKRSRIFNSDDSGNSCVTSPNPSDTRELGFHSFQSNTRLHRAARARYHYRQPRSRHPSAWHRASRFGCRFPIANVRSIVPTPLSGRREAKLRCRTILKLISVGSGSFSRSHSTAPQRLMPGRRDRRSPVAEPRRLTRSCAHSRGTRHSTPQSRWDLFYSIIWEGT